jgi:methoxymalonate biosynthesis acyl carrier protein
VGKTVTEVMSELRVFIRQEFKVKESDADFNDDVHLFDYGYVDSFGAVSILTFIESRFGVRVSDTDLTVHPLNTVREIATLVQGRLK